jgi:hypothetical protein
VVDGAELLAPFLRHGRSGADLVRAIEQTRLML